MKKMITVLCAITLAFAAGCSENYDGSSTEKNASDSKTEGSSSESENYALALEYYSQSDYNKAKELLEAIPKEDKNYDKAQRLIEKIDIILLGSSNDSSSYSAVESPTIRPTTETEAEKIEPISDGAEKDLVWLSYYDLNPTRVSSEIRPELAIFEDKGGSISFINTTYTNRYNTLEEKMLLGDAPDMFPYAADLEFPAGAVKELFQPIDDVVDFSTPMWTDVRSIADSFMLGGKHYVAPIDIVPTSVIAYDKEKIDEAGLEDPYELYIAGKWNWDSCYSIMEKYCSGREDAYGINGFFAPMIFNSTGHSLVEYDKSSNSYKNNISDSSFDRAADYLSMINEKDLYTDVWYSSARDAFSWDILFYAMGTWASSSANTPKADENWGIVPIPKDPESDVYYQSGNVESYMWVKGSEKKDAMRCWLECARLVNYDRDCKLTKVEMFLDENPSWTAEMYDVGFPDEADFIIDPYYGLTTKLSDAMAADNDYKEAVLAMLYRGALTKASDGKPVTWDELKKQNTSVIDEELEKLNNSIKNLK